MLNMDNTEMNRQDADLITQLVTALEFNKKLLAGSEQWFYHTADDPVRVRMQMLEHSISLLTDLVAAEGRLLAPTTSDRAGIHPALPHDWDHPSSDNAPHRPFD